MKQEIREIQQDVINVLNKATKDLIFEPVGHSYTYQGEVFFSVTTIMQQISHYKFNNIPQTLMIHKARIGSMTHYLAELLFAQKNKKLKITSQQYLDKVDPFHVWEKEYRDEVMGYWQGMVNYWNRTGAINVLFASEIKVIDVENKISGTIDNLRYDPALDRWSISDYKTSNNIDLEYQAIQLAGYGEVLNELLGIRLFTHGVIVQIKKDGSYQEYWFRLSDYQEKWEVLKNNFLLNIAPILVKQNLIEYQEIQEVEYSNYPLGIH